MKCFICGVPMDEKREIIFLDELNYGTPRQVCFECLERLEHEDLCPKCNQFHSRKEPIN